MVNHDIEQVILHRINFEPSKGCTAGHLMQACCLVEKEFRVLDKALQRLRKRGVIRFSKLTREWVIA